MKTIAVITLALMTVGVRAQSDKNKLVTTAPYVVPSCDPPSCLPLLATQIDTGAEHSWLAKIDMDGRKIEIIDPKDELVCITVPVDGDGFVVTCMTKKYLLRRMAK